MLDEFIRDVDGPHTLILAGFAVLLIVLII